MFPAAWLHPGEGPPQIHGPRDHLRRWQQLCRHRARCEHLTPTLWTLPLPSGQSSPRGLFTRPSSACRPATHPNHTSACPPSMRLPLPLPHSPGRGSFQTHSRETRVSECFLKTTQQSGPAQSKARVKHPLPSPAGTLRPSPALGQVWL